MNEKKRMEIEIIADTSKATSPIDKLINKIKKAGEIANGFQNNEIELNTSEVELKISQLQKQISSLKNEAKDIDIGTPAFKEYASAISEAESELTKYKGMLNQTGNQAKSFGSNIKKAFDQSAKNAKKFVLSLFGIRTAWRAITKAVNSYLSFDTSLSERISATWTALGSMLAPVVEKIVTLMEKAVGYINVFVKALTGVDFISKAITKSMTSANSAVKKTLSSMDEVTNLDLDDESGTGTSSALQSLMDVELNPNITSFMENLGTKIGELKKKFDDLGISGTDVLTVFGVVFGAAKIGQWLTNIGKLIGGGTLTSATGLGGIASLLGWIAGIGTITIEIAIAGNALNTLSKIKNIQQDEEKHLLAQQIASYNTYLNIANSVKDEETRQKYLEKASEQYDKIMETASKTNANLNTTYELTSDVNGAYDNTITLAENLNKVLNTGSDELNKQKKSLDDLGNGVNDYTNKWTNASTKIGDAISKAFKWVFSFGKTDNINGYASGGFQQTGELFVAREAGPELVGTIGGQSAVVNNDQIVQSVSQGVAQAVASVMGTTRQQDRPIILNVNGKEFAEATYSDYQSVGNRLNSNTSIRRA